ncbi:hypothetical protein RZS08_16120, partial [Arthrospira platensis SPKY1]|nr:hypothetical protein [Arthrospira platensis SPKY1]
LIGTPQGIGCPRPDDRAVCSDLEPSDELSRLDSAELQLKQATCIELKVGPEVKQPAAVAVAPVTIAWRYGSMIQTIIRAFLDAQPEVADLPHATAETRTVITHTSAALASADRHALGKGRLERDDVDDAEESVGSIRGRVRAPHHLDALDVFER